MSLLLLRCNAGLYVNVIDNFESSITMKVKSTAEIKRWATPEIAVNDANGLCNPCLWPLHLHVLLMRRQNA